MIDAASIDLADALSSAMKQYSAAESGLMMLQSARVLNALLIKHLKALHLKPETWEVLEAVSFRPLKQTDIATAVGRLKGSVSRWVVNLHEQGLVDSQPSPSDRRVQTVRITAHGQQVLQRANQHLVDAMAPLFGQLCHSEQIVATRICRRLLRETGGLGGTRILSPP